MVRRVSFCQLSSRRGTQKFTVSGRELLLLTQFDEIFDQFLLFLNALRVNWIDSVFTQDKLGMLVHDDKHSRGQDHSCVLLIMGL